MTEPKPIRQWYPAADAARKPSPWWYFGRAVYVSRRDYRKILLAFLALGVPLGALAVLLREPLLMNGAIGLAAIGLAMLAYSLIGLYRMYGHPSAGYLKRLLERGEVSGPVRVLDIHIGTYRHSYGLADLLPEASIVSLDCHDEAGPPLEEAVADVRALEPRPIHPRIEAIASGGSDLPLPDGSFDAVVFGFGTHEIPSGGPRERLFAEANRVLKPGGRILLFEHGQDLHNFVIFGPVIDHVTSREDWDAFLRERFDDVVYERSTKAVDLFAARRRETQVPATAGEVAR